MYNDEWTMIPKIFRMKKSVDIKPYTTKIIKTFESFCVLIELSGTMLILTMRIIYGWSKIRFDHENNTKNGEINICELCNTSVESDGIVNHYYENKCERFEQFESAFTMNYDEIKSKYNKTVYKSLMKILLITEVLKSMGRSI